jgi:putative restriction endonuclease
MREKRIWSREELIVALNLYLKLPFGKLHSRNKDIMDLASRIGRTANSVAMRLNNYAAVDPFHQKRGIIGLQGGRQQVEPIFQEFINNRDELIFESEKILANLEHTSIEEKFKEELITVDGLIGENKIREVKTRVNQHVFRQIVMGNYNSRCAITGIDISDLLIASHIIPWHKNEQERLNPENGICLSSLYDKAFDKGFLTINEKLKVVFSPELKRNLDKKYFNQLFKPFEGEKILSPQKYLPKREFLQFHYESIFRK